MQDNRGSHWLEIQLSRVSSRGVESDEGIQKRELTRLERALHSELNGRIVRIYTVVEMGQSVNPVRPNP